MKKEIYICDTNTFINLYNNFSTYFRREIEKLIKENKLSIPEGVYREIKRKTDKIYKKLKKLVEKYPSVIIKINKPDLMSELNNMERKYGESIIIGKRKYDGIWKSKSGRKAIDGQILAIAKAYNYIIVSDDNAIRLASMLENIECIGWTEFARRLKIPVQEKLF